VALKTISLLYEAHAVKQNTLLSARPPAPLVRINDCRLARALIEEGIRVAEDASASRRHRQTLLIGLEAAVSHRTGPKVIFDASE
jgi:hypothetical protein